MISNKVSHDDGPSYFTPSVSQQMMKSKKTSVSSKSAAKIVPLSNITDKSTNLNLPLEMILKMKSLNDLKQSAISSLPPPIVRYEVVLRFPVYHLLIFQYYDLFIFE